MQYSQSSPFRSANLDCRNPKKCEMRVSPQRNWQGRFNARAQCRWHGLCDAPAPLSIASTTGVTTSMVKTSSNFLGFFRLERPLQRCTQRGQPIQCEWLRANSLRGSKVVASRKIAVLRKKPCSTPLGNLRFIRIVNSSEVAGSVLRLTTLPSCFERCRDLF